MYATGGYETESKYDGGEDCGPTDHSTGKGSMGHNLVVVPSGQGKPSTTHQVGAG